MKTIIDYNELSQLTENKFKFTHIDQETIKVSGEINVLLISKSIEFTTKIIRVGFSSITLQYSGIPETMISLGLSFVGKEYKKAISLKEDKIILINLREIQKIKPVIEVLKLEEIKFEKDSIEIKISPR